MTVYRPARTVQPLVIPSDRRWLSRHAVAAYWILALAISWLIWLPLVLQGQGWANLNLSFALYYFGALGPFVAALVMTWVIGAGAGLQRLWASLTLWRVGWKGWLAAVGSPIALFVFAAGIDRAAGHPLPNLALLGQPNYLPYLGIGVIGLWIVTFGFGEEIGWRGFALPHLQNKHNALGATLLVGAMWALWHVPMFFYLPSYVRLGLSAFPMFALGIVAGAVVMTWLYNMTGGSVLIVAVWHALFDLLTATAATDVTMQTVMSATIMVWAVLIVIVYKPENLAREPRHTS